MKLISSKDKRHVLYVHVFKTLEGWGYRFMPYPQSDKPTLQKWQLDTLMSALKQEAKERNLMVRH